MPTYQYECPKCGHAFEKFQSITAEPVKKCPECKAKVKRLIGAGSGLIVKGKGSVPSCADGVPACSASGTCPAQRAGSGLPPCAVQ